MSRLFGRVEDVKGVADYLTENYNKKYLKDKTEITDVELMDATKDILKYLDKDYVIYINHCNIGVYWNRYIKDTEYSGVGEEYNSIFFPTKKMIEEYKLDLMFFIGDLLRRRKMDYIPDQYDVRCQYSDVLPLLMEYLYLKENNKEDRFILKHLEALKWNGEKYCKTYETYNKHLVTDRENQLLIYSEDIDSAREDFNKKYEKDFLVNTLTILVPLSSMDAMLQIIDKVKTKEDFKKIAKLIYDNPDNNRQLLLRDYGIDSFGHKRLRKEINNIRGSR